MYIDAGHAGWLGWPANISPAADLFVSMWTAGGKSSYIRGLASNVANYNALTAASADPITKGNDNYDETHYINVSIASSAVFSNYIPRSNVALS
jgi:cellulose 1,4-beta-cellobiosidase